jgi:cleavage and polyadenylation specificity factor subunit 1
MQALRHEILPPSGVEFAACLKLTPTTVTQSGPSTSQSTGQALFNVVVARSNFLRIFEVREEAAPISTEKDDERERRASVRRGTEAVEGEVEMDASGEGFVSMGLVKVNLRTDLLHRIALQCHCPITNNDISFTALQL